MRIAQLSTRYPPGSGGVERHVAEVSKRLARRGHEVSVYTTDLEREFPLVRLPREVPRTERVDGVTVHRLPAFSLPGELHYPFVRGLRAALRRDRPELLHAHTYGTNHATIASRHSRRTGTPFLLTAHYHPIWSIEGGWLRHRVRGFYDRRLAAPVIARAARVIVQSREEERLLRENGFALPAVVTIPPGYSASPAPASGSESFARSTGINGPFLLFVGRLAANKGLLPLVTAFKALHEHDPSSTLVLAGADGGQGERVDALAQQLGIAASVRRIGFVPEERLVQAFAEARLFVLPSDYEAFGLVLLEALAQGTPVIASRVGGIPEFIEDGRSGRLIAPADAGSLTEALLSLWDDPEARRRMGDYGRRTVVPKFDWERVVDRLEATYGEVARR